MKYQAYTSRNVAEIPQLKYLSEEQKLAINVVSRVLPFKTNNYVVENLIDWDRVPDDPVFVLNFPQKEMLAEPYFEEIVDLVNGRANDSAISEVVDRIRWQLNPHPGKQIEKNVPDVSGEKLLGVQHKYKETILFFPSQGQTCHAYCSFCFRWPQFVGIKALKFASRQVDLLIEYVRERPEITDILFTGGDPLTMSTKVLSAYMKPIVDARIPHLKTIRIGTKSLSFWPYRFVTDADADDLLRLFESVKDSGLHLALMAHFNHPNEMRTEVVRTAVHRIQNTGAIIRTQSPLLRHINDDAAVWAKMWRMQVNMGIIPYYMFIPRDTGAQHYFSVPLVKAWHIFREAYAQVSGIGRTVRGPIMAAENGKVEILGVIEKPDEKAILLQFLQNRQADLARRPFLAEYNPHAIWFNELMPAWGQEEFFLDMSKRVAVVAGHTEQKPLISF
jgi:KamA family protein